MHIMGICLVLILLSSSLTAQNSKITTGVLNVNSGDYEKAIPDLIAGN